MPSQLVRSSLVSTLFFMCLLLLPLAHAQAATVPAPAVPAPAKPTGYPNNLKVAFFRSCVGLHAEMVESCKCMILTFERTLPYDEFLELSEMPDPTGDPRFANVSRACLGSRAERPR